MSVFGAYALYYDLLYQDKDYVGETAYISSLIHKFSSDTSSLLDIGCGTGRHVELFSQMGLRVSGLDRSKDMISRAKQRNPDIDFYRGDLCKVRLGKKFDVVSALFHVVSYLTTEDELQLAFTNIREHLNPGGLFVFDCWHGPAVLHQIPEVRIKRLQEGASQVVRIAEPDLIAENNTVDVNYQIFVKENGVWAEFTETHSMRYLFQQEIDELLSSSGLHLLHSEEWMTGREPGQKTWSVVYVAGTK